MNPPGLAINVRSIFFVHDSIHAHPIKLILGHNSDFLPQRFCNKS